MADLLALVCGVLLNLSLSHWYPGSGVVLDCIDSLSLNSYLLCLWMRGLVLGAVSLVGSTRV